MLALHLNASLNFWGGRMNEHGSSSSCDHIGVIDWTLTGTLFAFRSL